MNRRSLLTNQFLVSLSDNQNYINVLEFDYLLCSIEHLKILCMISEKIAIIFFLSRSCYTIKFKF